MVDDPRVAGKDETEGREPLKFLMAAHQDEAFSGLAGVLLTPGFMGCPDGSPDL